MMAGSFMCWRLLAEGQLAGAAPFVYLDCFLRVCVTHSKPCQFSQSVLIGGRHEDFQHSQLHSLKA